MRLPKVFVTRRILPQGMQLIQKACQADIWESDLPPNRKELLHRLPGVEGILSLLTDKIDREVMEAAGDGLKVISNHAVGFDNIDMEEATSRRIPVGNTPDILTDATADFSFALLLAMARRIPEAVNFVKGGNWKTWSPDLLLGADITGATLGIIGFGRIGKALAQRAKGFNMQVIYFDPKHEQAASSPNIKPVDLDQLYSISDFISLHVPLNEETYHLVGLSAFRKMKKQVILINSSRGSVVDPQALFQALSQGLIQAAALDVTDPEPIPVDSPLLSLANLIITPHIASASISTRNKMSLMAAENLIAGVRGLRLPNCVNPQVYMP